MSTWKALTSAWTDDEDAATVAEVEACWGRVCDAAFGGTETEFRALAARFAAQLPGDPIALPTDLLSPLGLERRETAYTAALGYLLNPTSPHGLGSAPLEAFLKPLAARLPGKALGAMLDLLPLAAHAHVANERMERLEAEGDASAVRTRTDLWLEIPASSPQLLVVVECKLEATVGQGQLGRYERVADAYALQWSPPPRVLKVYLTPHGEEAPSEGEGHDWVGFSFFDVAFSLLEALDQAAPGPGKEYLRLFLASLVQKVLGWRWTETPSRAHRPNLIDYLKMRLVQQGERTTELED